MEENEEIQEEILIVENRKSKIEAIVNNLMSGESHLSYSSLSEFKKSPKDFIDYKLKEKTETDAMIFGSLVHCLVLEPLKFEERYMVLDDMDICIQIGGVKSRATKAYKEWKEVAILEAKGRTIISQKTYNQASVISELIKNNRATKKILSDCTGREQPIEWEYKNFKFKGFIDLLGDKIICDLKTCSDAKPKKFQRDLIDRGYYLQAAMYMHGIGKQMPYYIIAVDRKGGISVHQLSDHLIEHGMKEYEELLNQFNRAILSDSFFESYEFFSERFDGVYIADKPAYLY